MIKGKQINLSFLPSKGLHYPQDIEIYVKPMTAGEEMASNLERFGNTKASYYDTLLDNIEIKGDYNKKNLLFGDLQFIDLVRRLFTFELEQEITIKDIHCSNCNKELEVSFMFANNGKCKHWVQFEDYREDVFNQVVEFSDGTRVKVSPMNIDKAIKVQRKYLSNMKNNKDMLDFLFALKAATVTEVEGRQFESLDKMQEYLIKYFKELYKYKDLQLLKKIDEDTNILVIPFKVECSECLEITEVALEPTLSFHQE